MISKGPPGCGFALSPLVGPALPFLCRTGDTYFWSPLDGACFGPSPSCGGDGLLLIRCYWFHSGNLWLNVLLEYFPLLLSLFPFILNPTTLLIDWPRVVLRASIRGGGPGSLEQPLMPNWLLLLCPSGSTILVDQTYTIVSFDDSRRKTPPVICATGCSHLKSHTKEKNEQEEGIAWSTLIIYFGLPNFWHRRAAAVATPFQQIFNLYRLTWFTTRVDRIKCY